MRTNEERIRLIHERTAEIRKEQKNRRRQLASHAALGYILMGLLSFLLGVSVTILLYRLRRHNDRKKQEDREDEL